MINIDNDVDVTTCTMSTRKDGLKLLVDSLVDKDGFCNIYGMRVSIEGDDLYFQIPTNSGKHEKYEFLGLNFTVNVRHLLEGRKDASQNGDAAVGSDVSGM